MVTPSGTIDGLRGKPRQSADVVCSNWKIEEDTVHMLLGRAVGC
jgi:hypothetical protein